VIIIFAAAMIQNLRHHLYTYLLLLSFSQGVVYPVVIFISHVEKNEITGLQSLPVDFPSNGVSYYFGLSGNEEEKSVETHHWIAQNFRHLSMITTEIPVNKYTIVDARLVRMSKKVTTPPPEFKKDC
jgi:hypothetical protein